MPITTGDQQSQANLHDYELYSKLISGIPLFSQLTEAARLELIELMSEVQVSAHDKFISEGDFVDSVFFIVKGKAKVTNKTIVDENTEDIVVGILDKGGTIGLNETNFFSPHGKRSASVTALTDMHLLRLDLKDLFAFVEKHPFFNENIRKSAFYLLKLNFIKQAYPFSYLDNQTIYDLSNEIKALNLPANSIVFNKGDEADNCYVIQEGQVEVFLPQEGKPDKQLVILDAPQVVGEAGLLTSNKRNASVRTLSPTKLLVIERSLLIKLMEANTTFAESVVGFMLNRIRPIQGDNIIEHKRIARDGKVLIILENNLLHEYYQLDELKYFIWQQLDGVQSVRDLTIALFKKFKLFAPDMICGLLYNLSGVGFVKIPSMSIEYEKVEPPTKFWEKANHYIQTLTQKEFFLTKADAWITFLYQRGIWILLSRPVLILFMMISIMGLFTLTVSYRQILEIAKESQPSFLLLLLLLIPVSTFSVFAHEAGHAFAAKKFGYKVKRIGVGWFFLAPIAFTDTSELWIAKQKPRLAVDVAGILVDATLGGIFSMTAYLLNNPLSVYLWLFSLFIYFNAFKNMSPLKDYDGYFLVEDLLDIHQLRKHSMTWLIKQFPNLFRIKSNLRMDKDAFYYWLSCAIYLFCYVVFFYFFLMSLFTIFSVYSVFNISVNTLSMTFVLITLGIAILSLINEVKRFIRVEHFY